MQNISEDIVAALPVPAKGNKVHFFSGAKLQGKQAPSGFGVRVTAAGTKTFVWFHRVEGKAYLESIGKWKGNPGGGDLPVLAAIVKGNERALSVSTGKVMKDGKVLKNAVVDPLPRRTRRAEDLKQPSKLTVNGLLDRWLAEYALKLRTYDNIVGTLNKHVRPRIGDKIIYDLKKSHVALMLDEIAEGSERMADLCLAYVRKAFNWYSPKDDDFNTPIVFGMAKGSATGNQRSRIFTDQELRDLYSALAEFDGPVWFGAYTKLLLLTTSRRSEVGKLQSAECGLYEGVEQFTVPAGRYKGKRDHMVPLSATARELLETVKSDRRSNSSYFLFSNDCGETAFGDYSKMKNMLDDKINELRGRDGRPPIPDWVFHDLRRTGRSLMSRAKVVADVGERCLGHKIGGSRAPYDHHDFFEQKLDAFEQLAGLVDRILHPVDNVVALHDLPKIEHNHAGA